LINPLDILVLPTFTVLPNLPPTNFSIIISSSSSSSLSATLLSATLSSATLSSATISSI